MISGKPAKAIATMILGKPVGELVGSFEVRPPTNEEKKMWECSGLTVGDVWTFEMDGVRDNPPRQFIITDGK